MTAALRPFVLILLIALSAACGTGAAGPGVATLASDAPPGTSGSDPSASPATDPAEAFRAYAACMRENGVDMPDAEIVEGGPGGGGVVGFAVGGPQVEDEDFKEAQAACEHHLDAVVQERPVQNLTPEEEEKLLQFARCMREHGIDMPDPGSNGGAAIRIGPGDDSFDPEKFEAAQEACAEFAPGFIQRRGSSDGGAAPGDGAGPAYVEESR